MKASLFAALLLSLAPFAFAQCCLSLYLLFVVNARIVVVGQEDGIPVVLAEDLLVIGIDGFEIGKDEGFDLATAAVDDTASKLKIWLSRGGDRRRARAPERG